MELLESLESLELLESLVIGIIAGGIIGFFFGFKAGQMSVIKKFRQRPGLDGQDSE